MKKTRWLSALLALILVFSLCTSALAADPEQADGGSRVLNSLPYPHSDAVKAWQDGHHKAGDQVRAIVLTSSQPTSENHNLIQRLTNTESKLLREHNKVKDEMKAQQVQFTVNFEYTALLNGMSVTMDYADLDTVAEIPGVVEVYLAREYRLPETKPNSTSASEMINATIMGDALSADGSGKVIAVLDTGITAGHEAFQVYDGMLQTPAYSESQMRSKIVDLKHGDYYNLKVPYQYDYADGDNDAVDDGSNHGSHVAGIAAGYVATPEGEITFRGSAPDAQILAMKIFGSSEKTTNSDIYFAALEDAFKLGADVINMSIGSPNGFTHDSELETQTFGDIYRRLENAGIICCISAGNENSLAEYAQNWWKSFVGESAVTAGNVDYGVLGSPASYDGNIAVAAAENVKYPAYHLTIGEESFPYRDSNGTALLDQFGGQDLEFVMVPGLGETADFEEVDVSGKVAVIQRGEITFAEKIANAAEAGAIGAVIFNNQPGELVSMAIETHEIPSVFVAQEAGAALAALEEQTFHVDDELKIFDNPKKWQVTSFSSWGPTNDLKIKPTITGVGGNVNSVLAGTTNGYEVQSGTSMSSPNVAGGYATLLEAICNDNPKLTKAEAAAIARNRTISHAYVLSAFSEEVGEDEYVTVPYSPRQQGAGIMDLASAYLTTLDITDPLVELGDDAEKSGVYTITAEVKNVSDEEQTYAVSADVLTDDITGGNFGTQEEPDIHIFNAMVPLLLEEGADYTLSGPDSITLAAGETKTVTVTITLTDEMCQYLDAYLENGAFIEGYLHFTKEYEDAHATFMAFYGDWAAAPILETLDWRDLMDLEDPAEYPYYYDIDTTPTMAYLVDQEYNPKLYAGDAPFGYPEGGTYSDARIAVSNDARGAYFTTLLVVPTIIRNARHIIMIARNAETGEIYAVDDTPYCSKTIFDTETGAFSTFAWFMFDGRNSYSEDGAPVADDTKVNLEFYCNLPYGDDVLGSMTIEEIAESGEQYLAYSVPCVVDSTGPAFDENYSYDLETGELTVTVADNQYLAALYVVDDEGNDLAEPVLFADDEAGASHTVTLNIGQHASFYIAAMDYATNESAIHIDVEHEHVLADVEETPATCEEDGFVACKECELCGAKFVEEDGELVEITPDNMKDYVIHALGHDLEKVKAVDAACETDGNIEYWTCTRCGKLYIPGQGMQEVSAEDVIVKATGHQLTAVEEVPATCEADGVKAHWKCDNCGKLFSDAEGAMEIAEPEVIPALTHSLKEVAEVSATCETDGVKAYWECETCGKLFSDAEGKNEIEEPEVIAKLGHALTAVAEVPATCEADGVKAYFKCETCGKLFSDAEGKNEIEEPEVIEKLGHSLTEVAEVPATCEADGAKAHFKCETCGKLFSDAEGKNEIEEPEVIEKLAHSLTEVAEAPATCETDGAKAHWKCETCGKLFSDAEGTTVIAEPEVIEKLDHDWDEGTVVKAPSLIAEGEMLFTCKRDPEHTRTEVMAKLEHCEEAYCPSIHYTDVDHGPDSWSHEPIDWAVLMEITNGTSRTTFSPDKACTRAQAVTFLWRAAGCPEPKDADSPFEDVTLDSWYAKAVLWAVEQGITKGTSETTFTPDDTCTRAQIATFLWRMQGGAEAETANEFEDVAADAYYAPAVDWAVEQGITNGVSATQFAPDVECSRAQIVTFLFRCFFEQ